MPAPSPLPAPLGDGAFSVEQARRLGVTPKRLRAGDLEKPFHGVRSRGLEHSLTEDACRQYLPRMLPGQFFSHTTAAKLYGFPLPRTMQRGIPLHISALGNRPRAAGVIGHRAQGTEVRLRGGLPVPRPEQVWLQVAPALAHTELVIVGDFLVRRKLPLSTVAVLSDAVSSASGSRGIRLIRSALQEVRPGTDSPMETRLRLILTAAGLPEPVIGHTVRDWKGDFIATPDLCYLAERVAVEYEGDEHRANPRVFAEDIERRELLQEAGWYVIRVTADHVFRHPAWLAARVARALQERRPA